MDLSDTVAVHEARLAHLHIGSITHAFSAGSKCARPGGTRLMSTLVGLIRPALVLIRNGYPVVLSASTDMVVQIFRLLSAFVNATRNWPTVLMGSAF